MTIRRKMSYEVKRVCEDWVLRATFGQLYCNDLAIFFLDAVQLAAGKDWDLDNVKLVKSTDILPSWLLTPGNVKWLREIARCASLSEERYFADHPTKTAK